MATRGRGTARGCPVARHGIECGTTIAAGHLMCPRHWRLVPKDVQSEVWRTWQPETSPSTQYPPDPSGVTVSP